MTDPFIQLAAIGVVGLGAQWLAWRIRLPSILLLLVAGFLLGPVFGMIDPDTLLGDALFPLVSLAVGIILFEGGLTLNLKDLPVAGQVILRLITVGALATWVVSALGARYILGFSWPIAILTGAILIVTGPTVVGPLLRQIRPKGTAGKILKWEGILIDPVGAVLAVLVFEVIRLEEISNVTSFLLLGVVQSLLVGLTFGLLGAGLLIFMLKRYLVPDHLQNGVTLLLVVGLFALSDVLVHESGLLTVTVMGIAMANQPWVPVRHILEFKENLQVLLIGILFIMLAGRINTAILSNITWEALLFVLLLIVVARPLGVLLSTWRTPVGAKERVFLMWMAPRGIVAAAVASVFAFELAELGYSEAEQLAAAVFLVIVGTVVFYGLMADPVARRLGLSEQNPQGVLIVGAHPFARALAAQLGQLNIRALLLDNNYSHIADSRLAGLEAHYGDALSDETLTELDLGGIGRMLALTGNVEVNTLATLNFPELFGRAQVYRLPPANQGAPAAPANLPGRALFGQNVSYDLLDSCMDDGATIKATTLTPSFTYADYQEHYRHNAIPLGIVTDNARLTLFTADNRPIPKAGQTIIGLIPKDSDSG